MNRRHVGSERSSRREVDVWAVAIEVTQLVNDELPTFSAVRRRKYLQTFWELI